MKVYLDNGATSYPKAPGVKEAIMDFFDNIGTSVNRGSYDKSLQAERIVYETREMLCELFNYDNTNNVVFTKNITESLNIVLKGFLKEGDHVIISSVEHNAVMRPLTKLADKGVTFSKACCNELGELDIEDLKKQLKPNTKMVVMTNCSNVCGTILDLKSVGQFCKENDLFFVVDAAQTAGVINVDMKELNADVICFTGHKSLLGPQGIGGFIINDRINPLVDTFIEGGTGSKSESEEQPHYLPDKFESGTPNIVGIYGLHASLKYLKQVGIKVIYDHEMLLTQRFLDGIKDIEGIRIIGKKDILNRLAVVSIDFTNEDNSEIAHILSTNFGIATRVGLHCAPSAHRTFGTLESGTIRFSFSYANTVEDIDYAIKSINEIIKCIN